jgi:dipeptidyl-peptidase-4
MTDPSAFFPRRYARTLRFTLGAPRTITVVGGGQRVLLLRSSAPDDRRACLWSYDLATDRERLIADPVALLGGASEEIPQQELSRRERVRESGKGIVSYATDRAGAVATFALSGRLFVADLEAGSVSELPTAGPVLDPRPDPTGRWIAYVTGGALHVVDRAGNDRRLAGEEDPEVTWGLAEFLAAEEMGRDRGYWWAPDGSRLVVARADVNLVERVFIADPVNPDRPPIPHRYPVAGTANADVTLHVVDLDGRGTPVRLPEDEPYLVAVQWAASGAPLVVTQSRDQSRLTVSEFDPDDGNCTAVSVDRDHDWVAIVGGVPDRLGDGRLVWAASSGGWCRLVIDGRPVTPDGLEVRRVAAVVDDAVWFTASAEPTEIHVWRWKGGEAVPITTVPGVHEVAVGGSVAVLTSATMTEASTDSVVTVDRAEHHRLVSVADPFPRGPEVRMMTVGERQLRVGVVLPSWHRPGTPLPVLLDPYGGAAQRVLASAGAWLVPQWFAEQGFAVLVADGRGSPGRGRDWERWFRGDVATPALDDQVAALHAVAEEIPDLDLTRVAIRGWSFGGYLAALAVLRRPDVFHAAVVGAPVSDWSLYDTHVSERYLGDPKGNPDGYRRTAILEEAAGLQRPALLVHGLADDNVLVAHTLRLSQRLLEAGRAHAVLPLAGTTHMATQDAVAENLLLVQAEFLKQVLRVRPITAS